MKNVLKVGFLIFTILYGSSSAMAWQPKPLEIGETYTYKIKWIGLSVATATVTIKGTETVNGREAYVVEAIGKTNKFASMFYRVNDKFVSYIDKEKLVPLRWEESRREGTYKKDALTIFDHEKGIAYFENFLDGSKKQYPISERSQDIISLFYHIRQKQIALHQTHDYEVAFAEYVYTLEAKPEKKKRIELLNGTVKEAFLAEPVAKLNGSVVKEGSGYGYFSSDEYQIPVYFILEAPVFSHISVILAEASVF